MRFNGGQMDAEQARVLLEGFSSSSLNLTQFCKRNSYPVGSFRAVMVKFHEARFKDVLARKAIKPGNRYRLGRALEYSVRDALRKLGMWANRMPASKGIVDVMAYLNGLALFIQCKRGGALPWKEWNDLVSEAEKYGAVAILAERETGRGIHYWRLRGTKIAGRQAPDSGAAREPFSIEDALNEVTSKPSRAASQIRLPLSPNAAA